MQENQVGLGIDVVEISRMEKILQRTPSFVKIFSEAEREYCDSKTNPAVHYATRFAAKEAVLKALGTGFTQGITPQDVEVRRNASGRPSCVLHGKAKEVAALLGVTDLPISLSYSHQEAVACAMAITEKANKAALDRVDPMEQLSKQFKEVRSMLDDLDKFDDSDILDESGSAHEPSAS